MREMVWPDVAVDGPRQHLPGHGPMRFSWSAGDRGAGIAPSLRFDCRSCALWQMSRPRNLARSTAGVTRARKRRRSDGRRVQHTWHRACHRYLCAIRRKNLRKIRRQWPHGVETEVTGYYRIEVSSMRYSARRFSPSFECPAKLQSVRLPGAGSIQGIGHGDANALAAWHRSRRRA